MGYPPENPQDSGISLTHPRPPTTLPPPRCQTPRRQAVRTAMFHGTRPGWIEVIAVLTAWRLGVWQRGGGRVVGGRGWVKEMPLSCGFSGGYPILWRFYAGFLVLPCRTGGIPRVFTALDPHKETP